MTGPGLVTVRGFCPRCYQEVECKVWVTNDGETHILSGPEQHDQVCPKRQEEVVERDLMRERREGVDAMRGLMFGIAFGAIGWTVLGLIILGLVWISIR